jgi:dipeptidase
MKNATKLGIALLTLVLGPALFAAAAGGGDGECFTILVGRKASADGTVMVAHNEDDRGDIVVNLRKIKARDYGTPQKVDLGRGAVYETEGRTNGFLWIEATTQEFADSFVNDHGVVITSNSCPSRVSAEDPTEGGIGWMLRRLMAEKAASARDAVRRAGALIEKYGYSSSGRTYSICDKNEGWMLAVLKGRHWYAERVADDEVAVLPNFYTIRRIRMDDPDHFMGSPDIAEYAKKNGWYDEAKEGPFDFKKAFDRPSGREPAADGNSLRQWRGLCLITGRTWELARDYPFSVRPAKKVTPEALMAILRDHYEGTPYDATDGYRTGTPNRTKFRTICTASTIDSFIVSFRARGPEPLATALWLALGTPDTTVFLPIYYGVETLPPGAGLGPSEPDYQGMARLHFEDAEIKARQDGLLTTKILALQKAAEANYGPMHAVLVKDLFPAEREFIAGRPKFEKDFAALYGKDRKAALKKLDDYVAAAFAKVAELTEKLTASSAAK